MKVADLALGIVILYCMLAGFLIPAVFTKTIPLDKNNWVCTIDHWEGDENSKQKICTQYTKKDVK